MKLCYRDIYLCSHTTAEELILLHFYIVRWFNSLYNNELYFIVLLS